jgi:cation transport ATPase
MTTGTILHETRRRLRLAVSHGADPDAMAAGIAALPGVQSTRVNKTLNCIVVEHDGTSGTRVAVLARVSEPARPAPRPRWARSGRPRVQPPAWPSAALALAVPVLPKDLRTGAALGAVAARALTQGERLRSDPAAVLLDAASLASLAVSGQPQVVSTSVLLRLLSERLSSRLVRDADNLLDHLLPTEAVRYTALREAGDKSDWTWWPLRSLRAGDRVRLFPGDVAPVDGCVVDGSAVLAAAALQAAPRPVALGDHVAAGERLQEGTLELRAEADVASSRLSRLRGQVQHAIGSRDPVGRLAPAAERMMSLPLTAAALVLGLTGDTARAAAMLQADPQQGLDLALPLAREAALYALARSGLLMAGLEAIERLASARTLVLQDTGVMASGRWTIEAIHTEPGGDPERVRGWLAALADTPPAVLERASFPDRVVRQWVRHGALLRLGEHELHLACPQRLRQVWGLTLGSRSAAAATDALRRELAVVAAGRVVARVILASAWRHSARERMRELAALGFERVAVFAEADGDCGWAQDGSAAPAWHGVERLEDDAGTRTDWLADAVRDGSPVVIAHTVLRDLVPAGSVSLTPMDAEAGSHGVLLGDPLASLVAARRLAKVVHRRLRLQQGAASAGNAALMTAAALRWMPPMATTLLHHGLALLMLLDSLRFDAGRPQLSTEHASNPRKSGRPPRATATVSQTLRSETP